MSKTKTSFVCTGCGHPSAKWLGRCPGCEAWNTFVEDAIDAAASGEHRGRVFRLPDRGAAVGPAPLAKSGGTDVVRRSTGIGELDRVLGGGLVHGALVLVGGDPGIGKSTLLLQALDRLGQTAGVPTLYVTGEESPAQVELRASRTGIEGSHVLVFAETRVDRVLPAIESSHAAAVVIDSIQSIYDTEVDSAPGSVAQVREVAARFLYLAKSIGVPILLVGHVTKDGTIAGPRVLEHMVDTVLYFEQNASTPYRILRAHKNRFGSTNEIGIFEMTQSGLVEVENPSAIFLAERQRDLPGSVALPSMEGTRPVMVEVQALVAPSPLATPRRTCLGFDPNRAALLVAVLEKRAGLGLVGCDVFVNVAGGMRLEEPAADLAVAIALASSLSNRAIASDQIAFGEIGLSGELRSVVHAEARLREAAKLGFGRAILPSAMERKIDAVAGIAVSFAKDIRHALDLALDF